MAAVIDFRPLRRRVANVRWAPLDQAAWRAMYRSCNVIRTAMRADWKSQAFKRGGKMLNRRAIVRGVRVRVKRFDAGWIQGVIGIKGAPIINILDPGFTARNGNKIAGRKVRERAYDLAGSVARSYAVTMEKSLISLLSGGRG